MVGLSGRAASLAHGRLSGGSFFLNKLVEHPDSASSLLLLSLRLPLFPQLGKKLRQALFLCGLKLIFCTKVQVVAQPLFKRPIVSFGNPLLPKMILELRLSWGRKREHVDFS